ncbi:lysophospholipid acyltransferase family protein [Streptomyces glaucus]|uniref:lysophospholipid acyltransferase family protein n=1 Tax=Streptomyces glaucus TaxID=284029 RepID=UPI0031E0626D
MNTRRGPDDEADEGRHVVRYPEGTRSRDGRLGEFGTGAARLCLRTGAPAVPVALTGTHTVLPRERRAPVRPHSPAAPAPSPPRAAPSPRPSSSWNPSRTAKAAPPQPARPSAPTATPPGPAPGSPKAAPNTAPAGSPTATPA